MISQIALKVIIKGHENEFQLFFEIQVARYLFHRKLVKQRFVGNVKTHNWA